MREKGTEEQEKDRLSDKTVVELKDILIQIGIPRDRWPEEWFGRNKKRDE